MRGRLDRGHVDAAVREDKQNVARLGRIVIEDDRGEARQAFHARSEVDPLVHHEARPEDRADTSEATGAMMALDRQEMRMAGAEKPDHAVAAHRIDA